MPPAVKAQTLPLLTGVVGVLWIAVQLGFQNWRPIAQLLIGLVLGMALYHASFGFASAYRRMLVARDMRGVQAQLLLLALTTVLFSPVLADGSVWGQAVGGAWAPVSLSVAVGAFLFGIGMQIAGGCGSGTLYTAGGGSIRMTLVLVAACTGSFIASLHMGWWQALPSREPVVLADALGWQAALALQLGVMGLLAWLLRRLARPAMTTPSVVLHAIWHLKQRLFGHGVVANPRDTCGYRCGLRLALTKNQSVLNVPSSVQHHTSSTVTLTVNTTQSSLTLSAGWRILLSGPWPIVVAAVVLAFGNLSTLLVAGHPWSITWGFTLWGAKAAQTLGWTAAGSNFWQGEFQSEALTRSVLQDTTSLMDLAIMLGALCAASLAGRFAPSTNLPWRSLSAALLGGLLLGYGSRIAYGCNIGAFVSGVASGSAHGWLWIAAALPGSWVGIRWRRRFGLAD